VLFHSAKRASRRVFESVSQGGFGAGFSGQTIGDGLDRAVDGEVGRRRSAAGFSQGFQLFDAQLGKERAAALMSRISLIGASRMSRFKAYGSASQTSSGAKALFAARCARSFQWCRIGRLL
jgi:hypothetical protein